ncbi:hypothetical protein V5O48_007471 [Marasmius crinis-equi]|uniref:Calcium uniporter protein, mitochondrial n=1 Tax=Marasmius crinis-equi TaxID=585013 RepID=A0ABR3FGM4_9AGAR
MIFFSLLQQSASRTTTNVCWRSRFRCLNTSRTVWQDKWATTKVEHSQFLANASPHAKWKDENGNGVYDSSEDELKDLKDGEGKLLPTSSHLFKLILPMDQISSKLAHDRNTPPKRESIPTILLLHPSQPLSHLSRLILASMPRKSHPEGLSVTFRSSPTAPRQFQWSDSTDIGDFTRDAASAAQFLICVSKDSSEEVETRKDIESDPESVVISVRVPTFADRTRYLRRRLDVINAELSSMEGLKRECDKEAHRGARRMALGGFGMLIVYWGAVARLTFWDYGWDVMEPITYLSGLSTVICGYLWFLYQGREVSYSSVLDRSVSARRNALYKNRGLDIEKWSELVQERKTLHKEIGKIKEDYDHRKESEQEEEDIEAEEEGEKSGEESK